MAKRKGINTNPKGKGGFGDHPERICRNGALKSKGREFQAIVREWLEAVPDGGDNTRIGTLLDYLWDIASAANKQSLDAIKLLLDRGYGKPSQAVELSGPDGGPTDIHYDARIVSPLAEAK